MAMTDYTSDSARVAPGGQNDSDNPAPIEAIAMTIRKIWSWEWGQHRAHLLRLAPEDRRLRFCRAVSDHFIHRYCDQLDQSQTRLFGCFIDGTLRGVAELVRIPESKPVSSEIALSVERAFQQQGIGGKLLEKALLLARNRFIDTVHLISLRENESVQHLARKFDAKIGAYGLATEGRIRLPSPSYVSLMEEITADGQALISAVFEPPVTKMMSASALEHR
jgi:GNAT superfamily N-acetyltransferase